MLQGTVIEIKTVNIDIDSFFGHLRRSLLGRRLLRDRPIKKMPNTLFGGASINSARGYIYNIRYFPGNVKGKKKRWIRMASGTIFAKAKARRTWREFIRNSSRRGAEARRAQREDRGLRATESYGTIKSQLPFIDSATIPVPSALSFAANSSEASAVRTSCSSLSVEV